MIEDRETTLRDYMRILRKRMKTIVLVFGIVFVLVVVKTFTTTPQYKATTKVLIEKTDPRDILSDNSYTGSDSKFLDTQTQIIKSIPVAEKVVRLLKLDEAYPSFVDMHSQGFSPITAVKSWLSALISTISRIFGTTSSEASIEGESAEAEKSDMNRLTKLIRQKLEVSPVQDSRIVAIDFTSTNPVLAARITNTVAKAYIEQILDMRMTSSSYSIGWMTKKAEEERGKLEASEKTLQKYMKDHDILTIEDRVTILPQKLADISSQLTQAQAKRKEMEAVYLTVQSVLKNGGDPETLPVIKDDAMLKSIDRKILDRQQYIMELSKKYGPKHALMKNANAELKMLSDNRDKEIDRIVESVRNDYELAKATEENIQALLSKSKSDAVEMNERFIQYGILKREVETNRSMYDALVSKIKEQSVTEQIQPVDVWVVEEAEVPDTPATPNKPRNLLLGIVLGLCGGLGLALFLDYLDNTVKMPEDVEEQFGLPVLGLIPLEKEPAKTGEESALYKTSPALAEGFKALRSSVQLSTYQKPPKSILITSTAPKDGKTTNAVYLAIAMSQLGKKVLLIDADLRKPRIHKIFKLQNDKGISTSMAGASDMKIIQKSSIENLDIIPSGPTPPNPSELLGSEYFREAIKLLSEKYAMIIIDSPPLLSVMDGYHISKVVDGTIVIARAAKTTQEAMYRGLKQLNDIGSKILGIVINGADLRKSDYYYYNYYQYYSSEEEEKA